MFRKLREPVSPITIHIDGVATSAELGEPVAAVLLRQEDSWSRETPVSRARRAPYCMMGVCFDCLAVVDGVASVQTCLIEAVDGMHVERQKGTAGI